MDVRRSINYLKLYIITCIYVEPFQAKIFLAFYQILRGLWDIRLTVAGRKSELLNNNSYHLLSTYQLPGTGLAFTSTSF